MCASKVADRQQRGWIIPIGGAEEKDNSPAILKRFVELAGGSDADVVVIPTASQMRDNEPRYERLFGKARRRARGLDRLRHAARAEEPSRIARLERASGVFFTGGNQLRLSTLIRGTPVAKAIRCRVTAQSGAPSSRSRSGPPPLPIATRDG